MAQRKKSINWDEFPWSIVEQAYEESKKIASKSELEAHITRLLKMLQKTYPTLRRDNLLISARRHKQLTVWGMPRATQDERDRALLENLRKQRKSFPTQQAFHRHIASLLQSPVESINGVRQRLAQLGIDSNSFVATGNSYHQGLSKKATRWLAFATTWNNKKIRVQHELQKAVAGKGETSLTWKEVWKLRDRYKRYRLVHTELHEVLPPLLVREFHTGEPKELHPFVEAHLDEWKFDRKRIKAATGFVVGNYQWGALPNLEVIAAVKQYCAYRGFEFIVGLSQYGTIEVNRDTDELISVLPDELKGHIVVDGVKMLDFMLNCNTHIVQTADVYLTDSVCEMAGEQSTIYLGTKQEMRHSIRLRHEYPACYMTTGSLNHPHHKRTRLGKNNKAVAIAKHRHEYGIVVLELVKKGVPKPFAIPRQLRMTPDGVFYDIDVVYGGARRFTPEGHTHCPNGVNTLKLGDMHEAGIDEHVWAVTVTEKDGIAKMLHPAHVHTGDSFDNNGANPFNDRQSIRSSYHAKHQRNDVAAELARTVARFEQLRAHLPRTADIIHEPSNHSDDWLKKWVNRTEKPADPANLRVWHELCLLVMDDLDHQAIHLSNIDHAEERSPFGLYMKVKAPFVYCPSYQQLHHFLRPELGPEVVRQVFMHHGHVGPKGIETRSIRAFAGYNLKSAGGHVHSATRQNGHDQVGVMTGLLKHYVQGPKTNWTNSHLAIFANGETAHVFIMYGRWYGDSVRAERKKLARKNQL